MKDVLTIDEPEKPRWTLALDLIENGTEAVLVRDVLEITRNTSGPIRLAVVVASGSGPVIRDDALASLNAARQLVEQVAQEDGRFRSLLTRFGSLWELVADDGSGTILLATVSDDGAVVWSGR